MTPKVDPQANGSADLYGLARAFRQFRCHPGNLYHCLEIAESCTKAHGATDLRTVLSRKRSSTPPEELASDDEATLCVQKVHTASKTELASHCRQASLIFSPIRSV
jgi:hypothetical protein